MTKQGSGVGVVIQPPRGTTTEFSFKLEGEFTNNQVEYEALIRGLEVLKTLGARFLKIYKDSHLVINHTMGDYKCISPALIPYRDRVESLLKTFNEVMMKHVP